MYVQRAGARGALKQSLQLSPPTRDSLRLANRSLIGFPRVDVSSSGFCRAYRLGLVVMDLGWVDFELYVPPCCPAAQPIQPNSHLAKHNWAGSGITEI